jgi:SanA protein
VLARLRSSRRRRPILLGISLLLGGLLSLAALNAYVLMRGGGATRDIAKVRHAQVAIVPGALVDADGRMSGMLADRVDAAITLYRAGKVDRILVSGDHGRLGYDETDTMRDALLRHGIPARAVFTDYAGFNTWATMVRASKVFGVRDAIVVTQGFHMARALYLAREAGLTVHGLVADRSGYGAEGRQSALRELMARVKGVGDAASRADVLLGPAHPISSDGRGSWGPRDPVAPAPQ